MLGDEQVALLGVLVFFMGLMWFILCFIVADAWERKGLSYGAGFWFSFFFSPIIGILLGILTSPANSGASKEPSETSHWKECPDCNEVVKGLAKVCKFCGHKVTLLNEKELAEICLKKGLIDKAISMYNDYLKINPDDLDVHKKLGELYYKSKKYKLAIEVYKKAIKLDPGDKDLYWQLKTVYEAEGYKAEAQAVYEQYKKFERW